MKRSASSSQAARAAGSSEQLAVGAGHIGEGQRGGVTLGFGCRAFAQRGIEACGDQVAAQLAQPRTRQGLARDRDFGDRVMRGQGAGAFAHRLAHLAVRVLGVAHGGGGRHREHHQAAVTLEHGDLFE